MKFYQMDGKDELFNHGSFINMIMSKLISRKIAIKMNINSMY